MKFKIITILVITLSILISCDNLLNVEPETSITPSNFYQSQEDFEQAVTGIYSPLQNLFENDWVVTEMRSDNTHFIFDLANRGAIDRESMTTFLVESDNGFLQNKWNDNYLIISRANKVLDTIDNVDFDQDIKDNLKGQALFLRALSYFDLVKNFGGVPLYLKSVINYNDSFKARSSVSNVYNQIISDAKDAADLLPTRINQDGGKATSGAALTLLGDVFITLERWAEAETALMPVTNMGYELLIDYSEIFNPENEGNNEIIFEVEYMEGTSFNLASTFPYRMLPLLEDPSIITNSPSQRMSQGLGGWNIPTPDIIAAYEDTVQDERYTASIGYVTAPTSAVSNPDHDNIPYIKKYQHPHSNYGETDQNWVVYRYAEVLLMLAESINEQGRGTEALEYLDEVRNRAGLNNSTQTTEIRDLIFNERRIELAFENKRWHDLVRTSQAINVMNTFGDKVKDNPEDYYYTLGSSPTQNSFNILEYKLIYPIPFRELTVNPELDQNPGY